MGPFTGVDVHAITTQLRARKPGMYVYSVADHCEPWSSVHFCCCCDATFSATKIVSFSKRTSLALPFACVNQSNATPKTFQAIHVFLVPPTGCRWCSRAQGCVIYCGGIENCLLRAVFWWTPNVLFGDTLYRRLPCYAAHAREPKSNRSSEFEPRLCRESEF